MFNFFKKSVSTTSDKDFSKQYANAQLEGVTPKGWTYYTMPLGIFIEQLEDGTIDKLIYLQFLDGIKSREQTYIHSLAKEINLLEYCFTGVQLAIQYYEKINDPEIFEVIIKMVPNAQKTDTLSLIKTRSGKMLTDLAVKRAELQAITGGETKVNPDRAFFTLLTLQVCKHLQFQISKTETTVAEFAAMIVDLRQKNEMLEKEFKKLNK